MLAISAILRGVGRALGAPRVVLVLWLVNLLLALPAGLLIAQSLRSSIGSSQVHERLRMGFDMAWYGELEHAARGLETTFTPSATGAGAFFDNLEAWFSGGLFTGPWSLVGLGGVYALVWALLLGGVLDRFARPGGPPSIAAFLGSGGRYFFRFVRLAALAGLGYYAVYRLARRLFPWIEELTRDVTVERTVLLYNLAAAALVVLLLTLIQMVFDYAKIATVLEERHSALFAALNGLGFVLTNPLRCFLVYYGLAAVGLLLLLPYPRLAPGGAQQTATGVLLALALGQVFLVAKLVLRLTFLGSQMALYEETRRKTWR